MTESIKLGDIVTYKRNGSYGSYEAKVLKMGKRVTIHILSWCGQTNVKENWIVSVSKKRLRK